MNTEQTPQTEPIQAFPLDPAVNAAKNAAELKFVARGLNAGDRPSRYFRERGSSDSSNVVHSSIDELGLPAPDRKASIDIRPDSGYMQTEVKGVGSGKSYVATSHLGVIDDKGRPASYRTDKHLGIDLVYAEAEGEVYVNGPGTVKLLTGTRAEKAAKIIHTRAAREVGKRTVQLAEAKVAAIQAALEKVK